LARVPEWRDRLTVRIAAHDLALAAHRMLGDHDEQIERARLAVIESSTPPPAPAPAPARIRRRSP
jgi:hypothetical protein